ncbi:MAG: sporulation protein YqfD [Clostridia bacterium]|nr:sporulation protein YqfD [Clostridia bacterium]
MIDRILGWREIRCAGDSSKTLTDYLLQNAIPSEIEESGGGTVVRVGRADAKRIVSALRERGIEPSCGDLLGLPTVFPKILRRSGVVLGVLCAVLFFLFARGRVWEVRIEGDGTLDEDEVRTILYQTGLRPGVLIRELSPDGIATACLLKTDRFSGVNVTLSGTVAKVEWYGRKDNGSVSAVQVAEGANLIASRDGVIVSVMPTCGTAVVVPGQTVRKGDLLVSGVNRGGIVTAAGTVLAKVSEEYSATVDTVSVNRTVVKRKPVSLSLRLFGEKIFTLGAVGESTAEREFVLPGGAVLPFSFCVGYAHEITEEFVTLSEKEAAEAAFRRLDWIIRESLAGCELLKKEVSGGFKDAGYVATAKTEYLINIAEPLAFTAENE